MISRGFSTLSLEDIKSRFSDLELLQRYLGVEYIPDRICSPLREDRNPSFSIYPTSDGRVMYKDFGTGEGGDIYDLLSKLWKTNLQCVINRISTDYSSNISVSRGYPTKVRKRSSGFEVILRDWKDYDMEYWESFGIGVDWLEFGDVHPVKAVVFDGARIPCDKLSYVYIERKDGKITKKVYSPLSTERKWLGSMSSDVWNLWNQLPEYGDMLIIASSRKDSLAIWATTGIPSTSMQSETCMPKKQVIEELKRRFRNIVIWYDNDYSNPDNPGLNDARRISEKFNLPMILIPSKYEAKDQSDFIRKYGKLAFHQLTQSLLSTIKNQLK